MSAVLCQGMRDWEWKIGEVYLGLLCLTVCRLFIGFF